MTLDQVAAELDRRATRLETGTRETVERSLEIILEEAKAHSQGPLQEADLVRMGHPYARRRLRLNPNIVNSWTGDFAEGWSMALDRDGQGGAVFQTDFRAGAMERGEVAGRKVMAPRHPELDALEAAEPYIDNLWRQLLDDVFG